jgi:hypothetical protein
MQEFSGSVKKREAGDIGAGDRRERRVADSDAPA